MLHLRRPLLAAGLVCASAGCGGAADRTPTTRGPAAATFTVPGEAPIAAAAPACRPGGRRGGRSVLVNSVDGEKSASPRRLVTSQEVTLTCLRWRSWGRPRARATGTGRVLDCKPTCASGGAQKFRAKIVLSGVRRCKKQRFYSKASLRFEGAPRALARPAAYVVFSC